VTVVVKSILSGISAQECGLGGFAVKPYALFCSRFSKAALTVHQSGNGRLLGHQTAKRKFNYVGQPPTLTYVRSWGVCNRWTALAVLVEACDQRTTSSLGLGAHDSRNHYLSCRGDLFVVVRLFHRFSQGATDDLLCNFPNIFSHVHWCDYAFGDVCH
jgi:hypothetical protein